MSWQRTASRSRSTSWRSSPRRAGCSRRWTRPSSRRPGSGVRVTVDNVNCKPHAPTQHRTQTREDAMNAKQVNADITALLRARNTLLWITTREEQRVERALVDACGAAKYKIRYWDCSTGITEWVVVEKTDKAGQKTSEPVLKTVENNGDPNAAFRWLRGAKERTVLVMRDLHRWFDPMILRTLRSLSRELQSAVPAEARAVILLTPSSEVPLELSSATVIDYPLPDRDDVTRIIDDVLTALTPEIRDGATPNGARELAIDAALGLSAEEIANTYSNRRLRRAPTTPRWWPRRSAGSSPGSACSRGTTPTLGAWTPSAGSTCSSSGSARAARRSLRRPGTSAWTRPAARSSSASPGAESRSRRRPWRARGRCRSCAWTWAPCAPS